MTNNIMCERGYFWPWDLVFSDGQFAPNDAVHGTITIGLDGHVILELDRLLDVGIEPDRRSSNIDTHTIVGRLKSDGRSVLLTEAFSVDYTFKTNNFDHENYVCNYCLISYCSVKRLIELSSSISNVEMPFGKYEEWLCVRPIKVTRKDRCVSVLYQQPNDVVFEHNDKTVRLMHQMYAPWLGKSTHFKIKIEQKSKLVYSFNMPIDIRAAVDVHRQFHDLLIILSDQAVELEWPFVGSETNEWRANIYYKQSHSYKNEFERHKCWFVYPDIEKNFCEILSRWIVSRQKIDAGMYLYTSTRRGLFQYSENRFMMLVGGVEALHRATEQILSNQKPISKSHKIMDIVSKSGLANSKLRGWLRSKLKNADEPSLKDRLFEVISELPVKFEKSELHIFTRMCSDARNDIAHFGKITRAINSGDIHQKFFDITLALDCLYHARILLEIGVSKENVRFVFNEHRLSSLTRRSLSAAGLNIIG